MVSSTRKTPSRPGGRDSAAWAEDLSPSVSGTRPAKKPGQGAKPVHVDAIQSPAESPPEQGEPRWRASSSGGGQAGWGIRAGLPYLLVGLSLLAAFFLGAKLGTIPQLQPDLDIQQRHGSSSSSSGSSGSSGNLTLGEKVAAEAQGIFPKGCKWREVYPKGNEPRFWDVRQYEYWDAAAKQWTPQQPAACLVKGASNPDSWNWRNGSPRTAADCKDLYCTYENLWFNNGRFYLLVDGRKPVEAWKMTRNQELNAMHVNNASSFVKSVKTHIIPGDTLIFDFIFFLHPTAIGHWSEMLFPLFSVLRLEPSFARPPHQFVLLHLKKIHLMEWVRSVLAVTLGVAAHQDLPPTILQQEVDSVWKQILAPLEGFDKTEWICFERALVVRDTFTGGTRTFLNKEDAQLFRQMVYAQYDLPPPGHRGAVPQVITFQRKRANRRVINEEQMLKMLSEFGQVRVVEFNSSTSFREQVEIMSTTGVLISVHTSNLANAQFLPPGSAVVELIQRNWIWHNLDQSFKVQTDMMGDIHHYAWRARHRNQTVYINKKDAQRFGEWPSYQCNTEECVEAHTNVDVVVNVEELRALLAERLPLVYAGYPVQQALADWPSTS